MHFHTACITCSRGFTCCMCSHMSMFNEAWQDRAFSSNLCEVDYGYWVSFCINSNDKKKHEHTLHHSVSNQENIWEQCIARKCNIVKATDTTQCLQSLLNTSVALLFLLRHAPSVMLWYAPKGLLKCYHTEALQYVLQSLTITCFHWPKHKKGQQYTTLLTYSHFVQFASANTCHRIAHFPKKYIFTGVLFSKTF